MARDVQVTVKLQLTTTGVTREEILQHALEVLTNAYAEHGVEILDDICEIEE